LVVCGCGRGVAVFDGGERRERGEERRGQERRGGGDSS
jgi:hypothetical protein